MDSSWGIEDLPLSPPALKSDTDVTGAPVPVANEHARKCFTAQNPVNAGFFLTHEETAQLIEKDAKNREDILPGMIGRGLVEDGGLRPGALHHFENGDGNTDSRAKAQSRKEMETQPASPSG